eukprot:gnl/MRDRNA2_/MRDRNA2_97927_c0_seq1.p1 gnl/MRDRNA2_/MRDRNA2_97927_c0~~gnl/MRDRNA2_/MRDRNA2_97927_c0_seq1.p1  ORF type:complete len:337 (+),score=63.47 gnl/MRDRNA2_/MRDRNA2_97927_c0_seq1:130-1140(+)
MTPRSFCIFGCLLICRVKGIGGGSDIPEDLYEVLEVPEDADQGTLKKSYRALSIKYHPDKNAGEAKRFNAIRDAYEVLSDPEKRVLYDTGGMDILKPENLQNLPETEDISMNVQFTVAESYTGMAKKFKVRRRVVCRGCRKNKRKPNCGGCSQCPSTYQTVHTRRGNMIYQHRQEVKSTEDCRMEHKEFEVNIERGTSNGDQVTFKHMASQLPKHKPGHVIFTFNLQKETKPKFKRVGNDLQMPVIITLREALLGWERKIKHLDGHTVHVSTSEVTSPGDVIKIEGEGMPIKDVPSQSGTLDLHVQISFPKFLTQSDKDEIDKVNAFKRVGTRQEL